MVQYERLRQTEPLLQAKLKLVNALNQRIGPLYPGKPLYMFYYIELDVASASWVFDLIQIDL